MPERTPITADHIRQLAASSVHELMLVRHADGRLEVIPAPTYRVIATASDLESRAYKCREPERQAEIANQYEDYLIEEETPDA